MENRIRFHNHESNSDNKDNKTEKKLTKAQAGRQGGLAKHKCRGRGCKKLNIASTNLFS